MHLTVDYLTVRFRSAGRDVPALGPVCFEVEDGQFVTLVGPSGSGKSTLIRTIAGLQAATSGSIQLEGQTVNGPSPSVGMMFQDANLMPWRTVRDNVALPLEIAGVPTSERDARAQKMLTPLGLSDFRDAYPAELSGGMAQRVALGRVLIQQPRLLLLDEPFGALDAMTRERISLDLLRIWARRQQTVMMVTHDINEAVLLADRVLVLSQRPGRVVADIAVPLSRPRTLEQVYTPEFVALARHVREKIDA